MFEIRTSFYHNWNNSSIYRLNVIKLIEFFHGFNNSFILLLSQLKIILRLNMIKLIENNFRFILYIEELLFHANY
mgnify:CR=1 FL=1